MGAVMGAMALSFFRDRGALITTFILPPLLFLLFAAIFAESAGGAGSLSVAAARLSDAPTAAAVLDALAATPGTSLTLLTGPDAAAQVEAQVQAGGVDVGLVVRDDPAVTTPEPPFLVITDPGRALAGAVLMGRIHAVFDAAFPAATLSRAAMQIEELTGPFSSEQTRRVKEAMARAPERAANGGGALIANQAVSRAQAQPGVIYYAAAITLLFLLVAALRGAASLVEERRCGVFDRVLMTPGGLGALVLGKFAFLVLQGLALAVVLFTVAQLVHGVGVTAHLSAFLLVSLACAAAAAGVALALAAACRTRQQVRALSMILVLLFSVAGGAIAPRVLMPDWLQRLGELTPTAWGIEAYQDALWRGATAEVLVLPLSVLLAFALAGGLAAVWLTHRAARMF